MIKVTELIEMCKHKSLLLDFKFITSKRKCRYMEKEKEVIKPSK